MSGLSACCKWLLVGLCFAWLFTVLPANVAALRFGVAALLLLWALTGPFVLSWCMVDLAGWAFHQGYYSLACNLARLGVQIDSAVRPLVQLAGLSDSPFAAFNSLNLANSEMVGGRFTLAKERLTAALEQSDCMAAMPSTSSVTPFVLSHLATVEQCLGNFEQAHSFLTRSINLKSNSLKDCESSGEKLALERAIAADRHALGGFYDKRLAYAEAEKNYLAALDLLDQSVDVKGELVDWENEMRGSFVNGLGEFYLRQGKVDLAEPLLRQAFDLRGSRFSANHPIMSSSYDALGRLETIKGNLTEANSLLKRAYKIRLHYCKDNLSDLADTQISLAKLKHVQGQEAEAELLLRQALAAKENVFGPCHPDLAEVLEALCLSLSSQEHRVSEVALLQERARLIRSNYALEPSN
ncbi:MAG: tetratricopeptide repeat protein [Candidatus Obscuribacterales bacterium]|jgi:tetratricopeptide (TPR) repeat protein